MGFHTKRKREARGSIPENGTSPRIATSLPDEDMRYLVWWAGVKKIPASQVLRDAVAAYLQPFKSNTTLEKQFGSKP